MPRGERFAIHKLIVAVERLDQTKSGKDVQQAELLIEALAVERRAELPAAWRTAWETGECWRENWTPGLDLAHRAGAAQAAYIAALTPTAGRIAHVIV